MMWAIGLILTLLACGAAYLLGVFDSKRGRH